MLTLLIISQNPTRPIPTDKHFPKKKEKIQIEGGICANLNYPVDSTIYNMHVHLQGAL